MTNQLTPAGIEISTFRFLAQHLNHCATAVPQKHLYKQKKREKQDSEKHTIQDVGI